MLVTNKMIGTLVLLLSVFLLIPVIVGPFLDKIFELTSDLPDGEWLYYTKYYDDKRVFEFQYGGHLDKGSAQLLGLDAEDVKVIAIDKDNNQIVYSFTKDIEPNQVIQIEIPHDAKSVAIVYKGKLIR